MAYTINTYVLSGKNPYFNKAIHVLFPNIKVRFPFLKYVNQAPGDQTGRVQGIDSAPRLIMGKAFKSSLQL